MKQDLSTKAPAKTVFIACLSPDRQLQTTEQPSLGEVFCKNVRNDDTVAGIGAGNDGSSVGTPPVRTKRLASTVREVGGRLAGSH